MQISADQLYFPALRVALQCFAENKTWFGTGNVSVISCWSVWNSSAIHFEKTFEVKNEFVQFEFVLAFIPAVCNNTLESFQWIPVVSKINHFKSSKSQTKTISVENIMCICPPSIFLGGTWVKRSQSQLTLAKRWRHPRLVVSHRADTNDHWKLELSFLLWSDKANLCTSAPPRTPTKPASIHRLQRSSKKQINISEWLGQNEHWNIKK